MPQDREKQSLTELKYQIQGPTIQVVLDALKLTPFYNALEISADVPKIYMQEFWVTVTRHHSSLRDLGHTGEIKFLSDVNVNHMHQPWRSFASIINKCLSGKTTALESLRLSRAQILWGMYHNKHVDYVYLLWEDLSKVPDEQQQTGSGTNEGDGDKPEVPDVAEYRSESEEESWTFSQGEEENEDDDEHNNDEDDDQENENQRTESDNEGDDFVHPNLSTYIADDQEKEKKEEKADNDDDDVTSDQKVSTPPDYELTEEDENQEDDDTMGEDQEDEENEELVSSLESDMSELKQTNQFAEALSSIPGIVDKYLASKVKDTVDVVVQLKSDKLREEAQSLDSNMKRIIKEQTSYIVASSLSELKLKKILMDKIEENNSIDRSDVQKNIYRALLEAYNSDKDLLSSYGERQRSGKEESSKEATQNESKSTSSSKGTTRSPPKSSGKSVQEEEHDPRVDDLEEPFHQEFDTGNDDVSPVREATDVDERLWNPSGSRTPDREWNQTKTVDDRPPQQ
ncbi:hypothetical protein Tco_0355853, partial [Tanacetum coccineum]